MFYEIDKNDKFEYRFVLCLPNQEEIGYLEQEFIERAQLSAQFPTTNELDMQIVENSFYFHEIRGDYLIKIEKWYDDNIQDERYYIIASMDTESSGEKVFKTFKAYSAEYELNNKMIRGYERISRTLWSTDSIGNPILDDDGRYRGVLNYLNTKTTWSFDVGEEFLDDNADYRAFDISQKTLFAFLVEDIAEAFDCVFYFDTKRKVIKPKKIEDIGEDKGLYISDRNFINSLTVKDDFSEIATRIYGFGDSQTTIHAANPLGVGYIENFSYYEDNYMTDDLKEKLEALRQKKIDNTDTLKSLRSNLEEAKQQSDEIYSVLYIGYQEDENWIEPLTTQLRKLKDERDVLINANEANESNEEYFALLQSIEDKQSEIENQEFLLEQKENEISSIENSISDLHDTMSPEHQSNNFTEENLKELDYYTREKVYSNSAYASSQDLYNKTLEVAEKSAYPPIEIALDSIDFLNVLEFKDDWEKLELGDKVTLNTEKFGFDAFLRIVGYRHDIISQSLSLELSNKSHLDDPTIEFSDFVSKAASTRTTVDLSKYKWDKGPDNEAAIEELRVRDLDAARNRILAGANQNVIFDETGLTLSNVLEPGKEIRAINNVIAFTKDAWKNASVAITPSGVFAPAVYGDLIAGGNLVIENETRTFKLDGDIPWAQDLHFGEEGGESLTTRFSVIDGQFESVIKKIEEDVETVLAHNIIFSNENQSFVVSHEKETVEEVVIKSNISTFKGVSRIESFVQAITPKDSDGNLIEVGEVIYTNPSDESPGQVKWIIPKGTILPTDTGEIEVVVIVENKEYIKSINWSKAISGRLGEDGVSVESVGVEYGLSENEQEAPELWQDMIPVRESGQVIWVREKITYSDNVIEHIGERPITGDKGDKGEEGPQGIPGPEGEDGESSYTHIAYAESDTGDNFSHSSFSDAKYIGIYVDNQAESSDNWEDYEWTLIKGADGEQGLPGPKGEDGKTPYFHTAWANSSDGQEGFSRVDSENKLYIGVYTDFEETSSTNPSDYKWSKIKGDKGDKGDDGVSITDVVPEYAVGPSPNTPPSSGWSTAMPSRPRGQYLWRRDNIYYSEGSPTQTDPVMVTGDEARSINIIANGSYFVKKIDEEIEAGVYTYNITPDSLVFEVDEQNSTFHKWSYSTDGSNYTEITRTSSSSSQPWYSSSTAALTIPKGWNILEDNDFVVFKVEAYTGEASTQTLSIIYDTGEIEQRLSVSETEIHQNSEQIALRATREEFDDLEERVDKAEIKIEPDQIISTVTKSEEYNYDLNSRIDGIRVGARNYLRNFNYEGWVIHENSEVVSDNELFHINSGESTFQGTTIDNLPLNNGEEYIVSFDISNPREDGDDDGGYILIDQYDKNNDNTMIHNYADEPIDILKFTVLESTVRVRLRLMVKSSGEVQEVYFKNIKLEKGNKSTDWTPAPEDKVGTNEIISRINQTAEEIQIDANKISLIGAVNVLSDITGELGEITAGTITGTTIIGSEILSGQIRLTGEDSELVADDNNEEIFLTIDSNGLTIKDNSFEVKSVTIFQGTEVDYLAPASVKIEGGGIKLTGRIESFIEQGEEDPANIWNEYWMRSFIVSETSLSWRAVNPYGTNPGGGGNDLQFTVSESAMMPSNPWGKVEDIDILHSGAARFVSRGHAREAGVIFNDGFLSNGEGIIDGGNLAIVAPDRDGGAWARGIIYREPAFHGFVGDRFFVTAMHRSSDNSGADNTYISAFSTGSYWNESGGISIIDNNNVGINTRTPQSILDVNGHAEIGGDAAWSGLTIKRRSSGTTAGLIFANEDGVHGRIGSQQNNGMFFWTDDSHGSSNAKMSISREGVVQGTSFNSRTDVTEDKTADDGVVSFPMGMSMTYVGGDHNGWPSGNWGGVITFKLSSHYGMQICFDRTNNRSSWVRSASGETSWGPWAEFGR